MTPRALTLAALLASAAVPAIARAQAAEPASIPACVDAIPDSTLQRTLVYVTPRLPLAPPRTAGRKDEMELFTQSVAQRTRELLGASGDQLAKGEPALSWRDLGTEVDVEVLPDGRYRWTRGAVDVVRRGGAGAALLGRAIDSLVAEREAFFRPDSASGDTVRFRLGFQTPIRHADGTVVPLRLPVTFPAFTVLEPWSEPARIAEGTASRAPIVRWQPLKRIALALEFLVDTRGTVSPASVAVRDLSVTPDGAPPDVIAGYVAARREIAEGTRFVPARLGGCVVPEVVRQVWIIEAQRITVR